MLKQTDWNTRGQEQPVLDQSPVDGFIRAWRIIEKMALTLSIAIVAGTIGYVSLYHFI